MEKTVLVFATHNSNKAREIQELVGEKFVIKTLSDIGCTEDIPETGSTLAANASIKSSYVYNTYKLNCFADDTGLEVEALNGAPGVYSARYSGEAKNDNANMDLLLHNLDGNANHKARFHTVISLIMDGKETLFEGILNGEIINEKVGTNGFGYDPVFKPEGLNNTLAEMNMAEKNAISHRARAFGKLTQYLAELRKD
jgi:XTP/dITP diphosphohydrolase